MKPTTLLIAVALLLAIVAVAGSGAKGGVKVKTVKVSKTTPGKGNGKAPVNKVKYSQNDGAHGVKPDKSKKILGCLRQKKGDIRGANREVIGKGAVCTLCQAPAFTLNPITGLCDCSRFFGRLRNSNEEGCFFCPRDETNLIPSPIGTICGLFFE